MSSNISTPDKIWNLFARELFHIPSSLMEGLFNPYNSIEPTLDAPTADEIRRKNLRSYVDCFKRSPKYLLVGEAPGWRGCRFSGVPFTSEEQLVGEAFPFKGRKSSNSTSPFAERSANYMWEILIPYHPDVFLWNTIPLHPHEPGKFDENRRPTLKEKRRFEPFTDDLIGILKPQKVIAIGRVAEEARQKHNPKYIRHPSFGGASEFRSGMRALNRNP